MMPRTRFLALASAAFAFSQASAAAQGNEVFHVAIFRFDKENVDQAIAAFRELAAASRKDPGNIRYDVYRGVDDDQEFYIVEHWASAQALAAHERTEAFIKLGEGLLVKIATLHDAVTGRPFDVA